MTQESEQTLMTPEVKALIGQKTEVQEMYGTVDVETVRRFVVGIPDKDPRHWDEELARPRYGGTTTPPCMVRYIGSRIPPWEPDRMHEIMVADPFHDSGGGMRTKEGLPEIRDVAHTRSHLHAADAMEVRRYPKIGDRIFSQSEWVDIEEKAGRDGRRFLLATRETRYWNQDDELLLIARSVGVERP